jgi:hypothetical protein
MEKDSDYGYIVFKNSELNNIITIHSSAGKQFAMYCWPLGQK